MASAAEPFNVYIGWDSREAVASEVAAHSIVRRTKHPVKFHFIKHRSVRRMGLFQRPWSIDGDTGDFRDLLDGAPFTTEFSHTRFLVPELMKFKGWALFIDADMIFRDDIKNLFELCSDQYAVMCVKHQHDPKIDGTKMDGRAQLKYFRKNWSSFVMWNCSHPSNKTVTKEKINYMKGRDMHAFSWLSDANHIGGLPWGYNYISGVSPILAVIDGVQQQPRVLHFTEGGPWFPECKNVPFASLWDEEYRSWIDDGSPSYDGFLHEIEA